MNLWQLNYAWSKARATHNERLEKILISVDKTFETHEYVTESEKSFWKFSLLFPETQQSFLNADMNM